MFIKAGQDLQVMLHSGKGRVVITPRTTCNFALIKKMQWRTTMQWWTYVPNYSKTRIGARRCEAFLAAAE